MRKAPTKSPFRPAPQAIIPERTPLTELYTVAEAACRLGESQQNLRKRGARGEMGGFKRGHGWWFRRRDVDAEVEARRKAS